MFVACGRLLVLIIIIIIEGLSLLVLLSYYCGSSLILCRMPYPTRQQVVVLYLAVHYMWIITGTIKEGGMVCICTIMLQGA